MSKQEQVDSLLKNIIVTSLEKALQANTASLQKEELEVVLLAMQALSNI